MLQMMAGWPFYAKHTCSVEPVFGIIKIHIQVIQKKVRQGELTHQKGSFYEKK